ncbi:MAG: hypothetical protein R3C01_11025 [Planctomycetaceae bacterium]
MLEKIMYFDLGKLNWKGWLLFLVTCGLFIGACVFVAIGMEQGADVVLESRASKKLFGLIGIFASAAFFAGVRIVLENLGISIHREESGPQELPAARSKADRSNPEGFHIVETDFDGQHRYFATLLPHDEVFASGLPPEAILGEFTRGPQMLTYEAFEQNPQFIEFLADTIRKHVSSCPGLIDAMQRQQDGFIDILDDRTPATSNGVLQADLIGRVEIKRGEMIGFRASPQYRLMTANGFMQLDPWLKERLVAELTAIANRQPS